MPESPDFHKIAGQIADEHTEGRSGKDAAGFAFLLQLDIAEQLRLVWNARGAADLEQVDTTLSSLMGVTAGGPYVKNLERALRTLDR